MFVDVDSIFPILYVGVVLISGLGADYFFGDFLSRPNRLLMRLTLVLAAVVGIAIASLLWATLPLYLAWMLRLFFVGVVVFWVANFDHLLLGSEGGHVLRRSTWWELALALTLLSIATLSFGNEVSIKVSRLVIVVSLVMLGVRLLRRSFSSQNGFLGVLGLIVILFALSLLAASLSSDISSLSPFGTTRLPDGFFTYATVSWILIFTGSIAYLFSSNLIQATKTFADARAQQTRFQWSSEMEQIDRQRALGLLSSSLQHELRQPLAAMSINTQLLNRMLRQGHIDADTFSEILSETQRELSRLQAKIESVRNFISSREIETTLALPLADAVAELLVFLEADIKVNNINVQIDVPDDIVVRVPRQQFLHSLLHLLINSVESVSAASQQGWSPEILLSARLLGDRCRIQLVDNGLGMTQEELDKAGKVSFSTKSDRIGLGLLFVKNFLDQNKGSWHLISNKPGLDVTMDVPAVVT